ncbi:hypothetical protein [Frigoribacterium sp. UYMn621]|uniref:hypothetical protein n=1 Tax=Frigoribacterium sp. UYMn621 TaxID=3156343 RepID=UPI003393D2DE
MDAVAAVVPWVCVAIFVLTAVVLFKRSRNGDWVDDVRLSLNAQPRLNFVLAAVMVLCAIGVLVLGIGFLQAGYRYGWAFFPLAGSQLLIVIVYTRIARAPFDN